MAQFAVIQSPCWHILLAYNLGYLLCGGSISRVSKQKKYKFIIVNLISLICTILPFIYGVYGRYENNIKFHDVECYIKAEQWQYIFVVAICLSLGFHYAVIIIAICKWRNYSQSGFDQHFKFVVIQLLRFIVIYTIIRFFPVMTRMWELSSGYAPPFALVCAHHVGISLLGFADAVVWRVNQKRMPSNESHIDLENNPSRNSLNLERKRRVRSVGNNEVRRKPNQMESATGMTKSMVFTSTRGSGIHNSSTGNNQYMHMDDEENDTFFISEYKRVQQNKNGFDGSLQASILDT